MNIVGKLAGILAGLIVYGVLSVFGIGVSNAHAACELQGDYGHGRQDWVNCDGPTEAWAKANSLHPDMTYYCAPNNIPYYKNYLDTKNKFVNMRFGCGYVPTENSELGDGVISYLNQCPVGTSWNQATNKCLDFDLNKSVGSQQCTVPPGAPSRTGSMCGNPINVAIGNKFQSESDISFSPLLRFTRYYNSFPASQTNLLGPQWSHTYARSIQSWGSGGDTPIVVATRPEGNQITFTLSGGVWTHDADVMATLTRQNDAQGQLLGWTYIADDSRETENYDTLGRLSSIIRADGNTIALSYYPSLIMNNANVYRLASVTEQTGRSLTFSYDTSLRIQTITDPSGAVYTYGYDAAGNLSSVTYPGGSTNGPSRNYLYNEPAYTSGANLPTALTGIVHEDGQRFATFSYAADGRAISTEHAGGVEKVVVQYNADGSSVVTTPKGASQQRVFNTVLGVKKPTSVVETCANCGP